MEQPRYYDLFELIETIDEPWRTPIQKFVTMNWERLLDAHGSTNNHQSWKGGWWDHTTEVLNMGNVLYPALNALRPLPFTRSDLFVALFMHDIEKPWRIVEKDGKLISHPFFASKQVHQRFRMLVARYWGIPLTLMQINGIKYAEGELHDYTPLKRTMGPLAAVAHMCDNGSARLWPEHPAEENDPWDGAFRLPFELAKGNEEYLVERNQAVDDFRAMIGEDDEPVLAPDEVDEAAYLEKLKLNIPAYIDIVVDAAKKKD